VFESFSPTDDRESNAAAQRRIARWTGHATRYDAARPAAPAILPGLLTQFAGGARPERVVDLGSGTGLSTLIWAAHATQVVGIEPNDDMRNQAEARLAANGVPNVSFIATIANRTGLDDASVDIVTTSQAFHWMEPISTLAEVARVLRPGGVFAAYDYDWPPTITRETELIFRGFQTRMNELTERYGMRGEPPGWEKSGHVERMRQSGHFHLVKDILIHNIETGDADRFYGLLFSNIVPQALASEEETAEALDIPGLKRDITSAFADAGPDGLRWYVSYHLRIGVK
jgi:ubiquinone/menaquinone biosynthesis C-methylase UbiE